MSQVIERDFTKNKKQCYLTDELMERYNDTSPDYLKLKGLTNIPVFVFGQEMSGGKHRRLLDGAIFMGEGKTATRNYILERTEYDGPVAWSMGSVMQSCHPIAGEVYLVSAKQLLNLDFVNCNHEMVRREERHVYLMDQVIKSGVKMKPSLKCWVYLGIPDFWEDKTTTRIIPKGESETSRRYEWTNDFQFEIPEFLKSRQF